MEQESPIYWLVYMVDRYFPSGEFRIRLITYSYLYDWNSSLQYFTRGALFGTHIWWGVQIVQIKDTKIPGNTKKNTPMTDHCSETKNSLPYTKFNR